MHLEKLLEGKPEKKSRVKTKEDKLDSHATNINEFINIFSKFNEIKEEIMKGDQNHKIYQSIYNYILIVKDHLLKEDLFQNLSEDDIEDILEEIENYIMKKLHKK
jgi:hypothetical protein